jgi:hypothetical protein
MSFRGIALVLATVVAASLSSVPAPDAKAHGSDIFLCTPIGLVPWCSRQRITCGEGARYVDRIGFSRVRAVNCSRPIFRYQARKHGDSWIVGIDGRSGRIVSARPARPL